MPGCVSRQVGKQEGWLLSGISDVREGGRVNVGREGVR